MKKTFIFSIAAFALLLALISFDTASNNNVFEIVVNNSNLAPNVAGHPPGSGERVSGTTYYTNASAIQLFVFAHASTPAQTAQINLTINSTMVSEIALRPLGSAENTTSQITAIIPKSSSYSVNFSNYHHYEWREYPILSGRNGTLSINQTVISGSSVDNSTIQINESQVNNLTADLNTKVNKSGDNITGLLSISTNLSPMDAANYTFNVIGSDSVVKSWITPAGLQFWNLTANLSSSPKGVGMIGYATPGSAQPNICFLDIYGNITNKSCFGRRLSDSAFRISTGNATIAEKNVVFFNIDGTQTLTGLTGSGNALVGVDSTGKITRDEVNGYTSGDVFLCFNSTVGAFAC